MSLQWGSAHPEISRTLTSIDKKDHPIDRTPEFGRFPRNFVKDGLGHIPLNLNQMEADFYVGNCHKWMMAPKGAAFTYARRELQPILNPLIISHGWQSDRVSEGPFGGSPFVDAMEIQGTRDPSAWLTVPEALRFRRENYWQEVSRACSDLAYETAERLYEICGSKPIAAREFSAPQMVSIPIPAPDSAWFQRMLYEQFRIEIPVVPWKGQSFLRLSVQCYNTKAEMDLLVEAVISVLNSA